MKNTAFACRDLACKIHLNSYGYVGTDSDGEMFSRDV